jgi:hypothetical protein
MAKDPFLEMEEGGEVPPGEAEAIDIVGARKGKPEGTREFSGAGG